MSENPVAAQRVLRGVQVDLAVQLVDQYGEAAAPSGAVTLDLSKADGTVIGTGLAASGSGSGPRTYSLVAGSNQELQLLTAVWKDGGTERLRTLVEIVGGFFFSLAEIEAFDSDLGDITDAGTVQARARRVRDETERECERLTGCAWVPRYRRVLLDGSGTDELVLPAELWKPRTVRSVRVFTTATDSTVFTSDELAAIEPKDHGVLRLRGGAVWALGAQNLVLEVEHGYDRPPEDLRHAAMSMFRHRWNTETRSTSIDTAERVTYPGGEVYEFSGDPASTIPREVLRVYQQHDKRVPGIA